MFGEQLQNTNAPLIILNRSQMANLFRLTLTIALYLELQAQNDDNCCQGQQNETLQLNASNLKKKPRYPIFLFSNNDL